MGLKNIVLTLIIPVCFAFSRSGGPEPIVIRTPYDYFKADNLNNIYTIREDELIKYLPDGKFFRRYSNLRLGTITTVDVMNPLKILVYYRDMQQILFLDNQLSVNSNVIALDKLGLEQAELVCAGSNNSFWVYNKQNNELIRYNEQSQKIASTGNLKQVLQTEIDPDFMLEQNNYLYLNSPKTGILVFDIFGAFSKIISLKNLKQFQVQENIIYYQKDSALCTYDHTIFEETCIPYQPSVKPDVLWYNNKRIFVGYKDSLLVVPF